MIKEFSTITTQDLEKLYSEGFIVYEKLDMCYFRVEVTKVGAIALKNSTEYAISDIDCVTNVMYKNICKFVEDVINPIRNKIIDEGGEVRIGFFYLPTSKYHVIDYKKLESNTFILSDVKCYWSESKISLNKIYELIDARNKVLYKDKVPNYFIIDSPEIKRWIPATMEDGHSFYNGISVKDWINSYLNGEVTKWDIARVLTNSMTFSHLDTSNIEGIILRSKSLVYQIALNNTYDFNIDKSSKLICRDTVLKSFVNTIDKVLSVKELKEVLNNSNSYIDKVSKLFLTYIENTDLFSKYSLDPDDLLPPHIGYMGDVDLECIPDKNVYLVCRYNDVNKNIFRLFLHTFSRNLSENKFNSLDEKEQKYLQDIVISLNYKNYRQIMITAYKQKYGLFEK